MSQDFSFASPNYFQFPNVLVDHWLKILSTSAFKIIAFIFRKTIGWQKKWDAISKSQFMDATGLCKNTINAALEELEKLNLVIVKRNLKNSGCSETNIYYLNLDGVKISDQGGLENEPGEGGGLPEETKEGVDQKITPQKTSNNIYKKQQQEASPAAVSSKKVYECLEKVDIPQREKEWLTKKHSEDDVQNAINFSLNTEIRTCLAATLKWACETKPIIPKSKLTCIEANKKYAEKIEAQFTSKGGIFQINVLNKFVEFIRGSFSKTIFYEDQSFMKTFNEQLSLMPKN